MPSFKFKALDRNGAKQSGQVEARDETAAYARLLARKLEVFEIKQIEEKNDFTLFPDRIKAKDLSRYIAQLATLLSAGVTLLDALESLSRSKAHKGLATASELIRKDLRSGKKLSDSMAKHLPGLPSYVPRLAELGEMTGQSSKALSDAAERMELENITKSEIKTALSYPIFLASVGSIIVLLLFIFIVPKFQTLIGDKADNLPAISKLVLGVGTALTNHLAVVLTTIILGIVGIIHLAKQKAFVNSLVSMLETLPVIGPVLIQSDLGGWTRTVGIALDNGADLLSALRLGEDGMRSRRLQAGFQTARGEIRAGRNIDDALADNISDFDPLTIDLVRTGRTSGQLPKMLLFVGETQDKETRELLKRLTALAEPIAILLISMIVGTIVMGIVLAMTSLYDFDAF